MSIIRSLWPSVRVVAIGLGCLCGTGFPQGVITTVAGTDWTFPNSATLATAPLGRVYDIAVDQNNNRYIADYDNNLVFRITGSTVSVFAGNGFRGYSGDGGPAVNASLSNPQGVTIDSAGNVYISDTSNSRIRKVSPDGTITTVAGLGPEFGNTPDFSGYSGDNVPATSSKLYEPRGVAVDAAGDLYIADTRNHRIRKVSNGIITTVAGTGQQGYADNGDATKAQLNQPWHITFDPAGNLYIAEAGTAPPFNSTIRKLAPSGAISTVAGSGQVGFSPDGTTAAGAPLGLPFHALFHAGELYFAEGGTFLVRKINSAGKLVTVAGDGTLAGLAPRSLAFDAAGNLYIADMEHDRIRILPPGGQLGTYAGNGAYRYSPDGTMAVASFLATPDGMALGADGTLYISDTTNHRVVKVTSDGKLTTVAGTRQFGYSGDGGPATNAQLFLPRGVAVDANNNIYIADTNNCVIRKVAPGGTITTVAGNHQCDFGGDGLSAASAKLNYPTGVALDAQNNLYISDQINGRIRKVTPAGIISTIAGNGKYDFSGDGGPATEAALRWPERVAVTPDGIVNIADIYNFRIRKVGKNGIINTVAGNGQNATTGDNGPAISAGVYAPSGLAVAGDGTMLIAEVFGNTVRKVTPAGIISTIAGTGNAGFSGDGGLSTSATLNGPTGVLTDGNGNVLIADKQNNRIRAIFRQTPSFQAAPVSLSFTAKAAGAIPPAQNLAISGTVDGLGYSVSTETQSGVNWLTASPASGSSPANLQVTVDPTTLQPGTYSGTITVSVPAAQPFSQKVSVNFTVTAGDLPKLGVDTSKLAFAVFQGQAPATASVNVTNLGGGSLAFTATVSTDSGQGWLKLSASSGNSTPSTPATLQVTADAGTLAAGSYTGTITFNGSATGEQIKLPVSMSVTTPQPKILLSQTAVSFTAVSRGGSALPQTIGILNAGTGTMSWTAAASTLSGSNWLSISQTSGAVNTPLSDVSNIDLKVDGKLLDPGDYYGKVEVRVGGADNSPQTVQVLLTVLPAGTAQPPEVRPTGLVFTGTAGGVNPGSQTVSVANPTATPVSYGSSPAFSGGGNWFLYQPSDAVVKPEEPVRIAVQPDFTGLGADVRRAALTLVFGDGTVKTVSILSVLAPATSTGKGALREAAGCSPTKLIPTFTTLNDGDTVPSGQGTAVEVQVVDDCGTQITNGSVSAFFSNSDPQLTLNPVQGGRWSASWQPRNTASNSVQVAVTALYFQGPTPLGGNSKRLSLRFRSGASAARVAEGSLVNAASFVAGVPVAPGSLISLFGSNLAEGTAQATTNPLKTDLMGTQVVLAGRALPLVYVSANQINAQIPYDVPANSQNQLLVQRGQTLSVPADFSVAAAQPAVFTKDKNGKGPGAIFHANNAVVDANSPAHASETVVIYSTGLGPVNPSVPSGSGATGLSRTVNPVTVTIGGKNAHVDFSGLTPGFAGLYQVNAVVPQGVTPGNEVPVTLVIAGQTSPQVTMAVR